MSPPNVYVIALVCLPLAAVARKARDLTCADRTHFSHTDLCHHALNAATSDGCFNTYLDSEDGGPFWGDPATVLRMNLRAVALENGCLDRPRAQRIAITAGCLLPGDMFLSLYRRAKVRASLDCRGHLHKLLVAARFHWG